MAIFNKCLCCEIRIGVIIIAILGIASCCYQFWDISRGLRYADENKQHKWAGVFSDVLKAGIAFFVVNFIISVVLLICAALHQPKYKVGALIWVVWTSIADFLVLIYIILAFILIKAPWQWFLFDAIYCLVAVLCILVVISYYQQLRDEDQQFSGLATQEYSPEDAAPPAYSEKEKSGVV